MSKEGICADCKEHCEAEYSEEDELELSSCCGAAVIGEGDGYDEDYGSAR